MDQRPGRMPTITVDALRHNQLFAGLDTATLEALAAELPPHIVGPGDVIMAEGDLARDMFVVITGELEVLSHGGSDSADVRVALLGPGDWCGEMAILDVQPRSATVRALAPSVLLRVSGADVKRLVLDRDVHQYARILLNISRELSRRLRVADRLIAQSSAAMAKQYVLESMRPPPPPPGDE